MPIRRSAAAAITLVALLVAALPAAGSAARPTRLWYRVHVHLFVERTSTEPNGNVTEEQRSFDFATSESILVRSTPNGLLSHSNGVGYGYHQTLLDSSSPPPRGCSERDHGIRFERSYGPGAVTVVNDLLILHWNNTRGDVTSNHDVGILDREGKCERWERTWSANLQAGFAGVHLNQANPTLLPRSRFGRQYLEVAKQWRDPQGRRYKLDVDLSRCPGTTPCAGRPPKPPPGLPPARP